MSLLSKFIKPLSLIAVITASSVFASDIPIDNHIVTDRGDPAYGGNQYQIDKMVVNWDANNQITVDVYTNFGASNNVNDDYGSPIARGSRSIIYGDLLLGTTGSESDFNYAFSLGELNSQGRADVGWDNYYGHTKTTDHERYYRHKEDTSNTYSTGGLYAIDDTKASRDYHLDGGVEEGEVFGDIADRNNKTGNGTWTVNNSSTDFDIFSFSFNVANVEAFQNADQLALSWTMSCYNDAVTALITKAKGPVAVPTPTSFLLMLLALVLLYAKKRNNITTTDFSA